MRPTESPLRAVHMPGGVIVHLLRRDSDPGQALCGHYAHRTSAGDPIAVDPTRPLGRTPGGERLSWCGKCLGIHAVVHGRGDWLAEQLFGRRP